MMNGFGGHGWGMGIWWIIGLVIIAAIVWMLVKNRNIHKQANNRTGSKSAEEVLKERYAKGEIEKEEYDKKRKALVRKETLPRN